MDGAARSSSLRREMGALFGIEISLLIVLALSAAAWTVSAGIIHFIASTDPDHHAHPLLLSFFVASGVLQVAWALLLVWRPTHRRLLVTGMAGNALVVMVWVVSRTVGIPFVNGGVPEPVGLADAASTLLEVAAAASLVLAIALPGEAAMAMLRRGGGLVVAATAGSLALLVPSVVFFPGEMGPASQMPAMNTASVHPDTPMGTEGKGPMPSVPGMQTNPDQMQSFGRQIGLPMTVMSSQPGSAEGQSMQSGVQMSPASGPQMQPGMAMAPAGGQPVMNRAQPDPPAMTFWGQRTVVRYGPIPLPPNSLGGGLHNLVSPAFNAPCTNCVMTGIIPDMVYADGSQANIDTGVMLHHIVIFDTSQGDYTCPRNDGIGVLGRRLFAAGNERTAVSAPQPFGISAGTGPWAGLFDLMNMGSQPKNVYLQFTVYHVPASTPGIRTVVPVWLDIKNCGDSEFSVPAGRSETTWQWTSNLTGRVIVAGGHVHNGGVSITLSDPTEGERICTAMAGYNTKPRYNGNIDSMEPVCRWDRLGIVRAGDKLKLDAVYDTPRPLSGVMGIMLIAVYPTNDLSGGTPPPSGATGPSGEPGSSSGGMAGMPGMS